MSAYIQLKDLAFFQDGTVFDHEGGLHVITSQVDVCPTWLIETLCSRAAVDANVKTVLITFLDTAESHKRPLKKLGLNITSNGVGENFKYVDLSDIALETSGSTTVDIDALVSKIAAYLTPDPTVIILENVDMLIATGAVLGPNLSRFVYKLKKIHPKAKTTVIINCQVDQPLFEGIGPLSDNQGLFVTRIIMQSSLVVSLRPFTTGRADDVTGILRVTRGGTESSSPVSENEYLYLVTGDSAKIFYR